MRHRLQRALSVLTVLALVWGLAAPAAASYALGEDLTAVDTELHRETRLSTNVFWSTSSSDLRTENFITYRPGYDVTPIVSTGSVVTERSTVSAVARQLEEAGYRVVAGINGDFYSVGNGVPVGIVVTEGALRCSDGGFHAIGFRADGSAILGKPTVALTANLGYTDENGSDVTRRITGINKARESTAGTYLYTYDFNKNHTTGNTEAGIDVVCNIVEGRLAIGETLVLSVERVLEASSATAIGENQVVLSVNLKSDAYQVEGLRGVPEGAVISVTATAADEAWNDVEYAMGALYSLVENGAVVSGLQAGAAPRTAVGQTAEGDLIFYTIDGRRSGHSIGASMSQVGARLVELGCVTALCLDGGGSTTISVTRPDQTAAKTINRPSDGGERAVTNQLFLVASNQPTGELDHFYVQAEHAYVLAGSGVKISAAAIDTNYIPMEGDYILETSDGEIRDGGTVVTPKSGGEITVTARDGRSRGETVIHAIANPTSVDIRGGDGAVLQNLSAAPGSTTQLTASAFYNHTALYAEPEAFVWEVTGDIGTVDQKGNFTALNPGSGTITASAGGRTAAVQVTVSGSPLRLLEDFEDDALLFNLSDYGSTLTRTSGVETVRLGRGAGKWDYTLDLSNDIGTGFKSQLCFTAPVMTAPHDTLGFWLYGDGSGNVLTLQYSDGVRNGLEVFVTALDFTGWKRFTVSLSDLAVQEIEGLVINREMDIAQGSGGSGTVYLDHLILSRNNLVDTQAPAVTLNLQGTALTGLVKDAVDGAPARDLVSVAYDGRSLDFTYNESTGALSAVLPAAGGGAHRVTVTARDVSGNIGRASWDIAPGEDRTPHFSDTKTYWAADYCEFLYEYNIDRGYSDGSFRPDQNLTRLQFAVMLYNTLVHMGRLDPARYTNVTLPFADAGKISDRSLPAIRALYTEGIINGAMGKDGKLYFNPDSGLTRAQASAMIGRTQDKGYAETELTFTDAGKIPDYAVYYVQSMTAQGIIGGYQDNTFKPGNSITRGQMAKILYYMM